MLYMCRQVGIDDLETCRLAWEAGQAKLAQESDERRAESEMSMFIFSTKKTSFSPKISLFTQKTIIMPNDTYHAAGAKGLKINS